MSNGKGITQCLRDAYFLEETFTIDEVLNDALNDEKDFSRKQIANAINSLVSKNEVRVVSRGRNGNPAVYQFNDKPIPVQKRTPKRTPIKASKVKHIPDIIGLQNKIKDLDITYADLGITISMLLKQQAETIDRLEKEIIDIKYKKENDCKALKEILAGKDKTIEELNEKVEALRNRNGSFKLSDVARITE